MAKRKTSTKGQTTLKKVIAKAKVYHRKGMEWQKALKKAGKEVRKS